MKLEKRKIIGISLIAIVLLIGGYFLFQKVEEEILKKEGESFVNWNLTSVKESGHYKTHGSYRKVEKLMKSYFYRNSKKLNDALKIKTDAKFVSLLSFDNYSKDGPNFTESFAYLETSKKTFETELNELVGVYSDENILKNADSLKGKYLTLYKDIMYQDGLKTKYDGFEQSIQSVKEQMNHTFDIVTQTLQLLANNQGKWYLEEKEIKFTSKELFAQYQNLVSQVSNIKGES